MADNIVKMVYPEAEQMVKVLNEACSQLHDTISEMQGVATAMEGGALLGKAGESFAGGVRGKLISSISKLIEGLEDGARYVNVEKEDLQQAEKKSAGLF